MHFKRKRRKHQSMKLNLVVKDLRSYTMKKIKPVLTKSAKELAAALGLNETVGIEFEIRSDLNDKIIETVMKQRLTHAQVAKLAKTSRTRITALMNRQSRDISTDLMLRILGAIGIHAKIQFKKLAA
jgi:predicted XRE-type DNA-binding protein